MQNHSAYSYVPIERLLYVAGVHKCNFVFHRAGFAKQRRTVLTDPRYTPRNSKRWNRLHIDNLHPVPIQPDPNYSLRLSITCIKSPFASSHPPWFLCQGQVAIEAGDGIAVRRTHQGLLTIIDGLFLII
jgi:hypothetical protein